MFTILSFLFAANAIQTTAQTTSTTPSTTTQTATPEKMDMNSWMYGAEGRPPSGRDYNN